MSGLMLAAMRWARFDPRRTLARRPDDILPFAEQDALGGQALLLDTCVYIDQMQGRARHWLSSLSMDGKSTIRPWLFKS
jgi:hypothetical protein